MTLAMNLQDLQQENEMLLTTEIMDNMVEEMKMMQALNLIHKWLKQILMLYLKIVTFLQDV